MCFLLLVGGYGVDAPSTDDNGYNNETPAIYINLSVVRSYVYAI